MAQVLASLSRDGAALQRTLDALSLPIYLTDAAGNVTHFNRACINFAGRRPIPGRDRWCVTWRLYTERGEFLPHSSCPMALAIREGRPIRGVRAVAERPDGTRVVFTPFPTPILSKGVVTGAVNLLLDVTDARQIEALRDQAKRCRMLARAAPDPDTATVLDEMAQDYEAKALALESARR